MIPTHANAHPPGDCDNCALEIARANKSAFYHIAEGMILRGNDIATRAQVHELISLCHEHLATTTDEEAAAINAAYNAREREWMQTRTARPKKETPKGYLYLLINHANGCYKIGFSQRPQYREKTLAAQEPKIEMLAVVPGTMGEERAMHERFAAKRIRGEWFNLDALDVETIKWEWSVPE